MIKKKKKKKGTVLHCNRKLWFLTATERKQDFVIFTFLKKFHLYSTIVTHCRNSMIQSIFNQLS